MYNNALSFTSLRANIDPSVRGQRGVHVFRISGGLTHFISSIEPVNEHGPGFSQIFVVGSGGTEEAKNQIWKATCGSGVVSQRGPQLSPALMTFLMNYMDAVNPYAKMYRLAKVVLKMNNAKTLAIQSVLKPSSDPKRYDLPAVDKVEVVIQGEGILTDKRQIVLHWKQGGLDSISDTHSAYFPLCYRLLFPLGLQQWDNLYQANTTQVFGRKITSLEWFCFLLFQRDVKFSAILAAGPLLQEFVTDAWVVVERGRLLFVKLHQEQLQAASY
ncbi:hypothetical protein PCANC_25660 [Puccinia coronata f. sp. avenae]|uniref:Uncharacterized protein n=1 Tax=Puccinia coronata f. sp. avenae TaxID=200324 RepID=A0A2N5SC59_9BASI|nr:hypothetical protein PCANC_25660 [Puccinia coronata f. sp. avenae]